MQPDTVTASNSVTLRWVTATPIPSTSDTEQPETVPDARPAKCIPRPRVPDTEQLRSTGAEPSATNTPSAPAPETEQSSSTTCPLVAR